MASMRKRVYGVGCSKEVACSIGADDWQDTWDDWGALKTNQAIESKAKQRHGNSKSHASNQYSETSVSRECKSEQLSFPKSETKSAVDDLNEALASMGKAIESALDSSVITNVLTEGMHFADELLGIGGRGVQKASVKKKEANQMYIDKTNISGPTVPSIHYKSKAPKEVKYTHNKGEKWEESFKELASVNDISSIKDSRKSKSIVLKQKSLMKASAGKEKKLPRCNREQVNDEATPMRSNQKLTAMYQPQNSKDTVHKETIQSKLCTQTFENFIETSKNQSPKPKSAHACQSSRGGARGNCSLAHSEADSQAADLNGDCYSEGTNTDSGSPFNSVGLIQHLVQEKGKLAQENARLVREVERMQELLSYTMSYDSIICHNSESTALQDDVTLSS